MSKPLRLHELRDKLDKWLPLHSEPELEPTVMVDAAAGSAYPVWNADTLTDLVGDNPAMHARLLKKFLTNAQVQVAEITTAAAASDLATLAGVAHMLKSSARSTGALRLGELCQRLETTGRAGDAQQCSAMAIALAGEFAAASAAINGHLGL